MSDRDKEINRPYLNNILFRPEKWKTITPIWFNWLRWFITLGAVGYLAEKTKNPGLQIIYGVSYIAFYMFITTTISDILNLKVIRKQLFNRIITLCIALIVLAATYYVLHQSIEELLKG